MQTRGKAKLALLLLAMLPGISSAWLPGWSYRTQVNISSTNALSDYQVAVNTTNLVYNNTGLVGSWHFSEGAGTRAADSSGNGNDGTLTNGPLWNASGKAGYALQFDGVNDYVAVSDSANLNLPDAGFSIEAWFKTGSSASQILLSKGVSDANEEYTVNIEPGRVYFDYGAGTGYVIASTSVADNQWHHIALLYNTAWSPKGKVYVDGVEKTITQSGGGSHIVSSGSALYIGTQAAGAFYYGGRSPFSGLIDEVRIYNRSLSAQEIQARYNASRLRPDYADLRFANSTDALLPYWLESDNRAWVRVPQVPSGASTIYAYYGNVSVTSASNGTNTFLFFDDFDGTSLDTAKWALSGTVNVSGSIASFNVDLTNIQSLAAFNVNTTLETLTSLPSAPAYSWFGFSDVSGFGNGQNELDISNGGGQYIQSRLTGVWGTSLSIASYTGFRKWKIIRKSTTNALFYVDDISLLQDRTVTVPMGALKVNFQRSASSLAVDWVLVRKYASPEPTTSLLAEDEALQLAYRKNILLNNPGSALTDYQVNLTIDTAALVTAGKMKSDCADLRFTDSTSYNTQDWASNHKYWIESGCNTSATRVWVKVPAIPTGTSTIYAYYGNASAASASNGANTFMFFDDFTGSSLDTSKWTMALGSAAVSNSEVYFNAEGWLKSIPLFGTNTSLKFRTKTTVTTMLDYGYGAAQNNDASIYETESPHTQVLYTNNVQDGGISAFSTAYQTREIKRESTMSVKAYTNDIYDTQSTANINSNSVFIGFYDWSTGTTYIDWAFVRKYVSPEPTAIEQLPDTIPPLVLIQSPNSTTYTSSTVPVNFTATDNVGISSCTVRLNGTINSSTCSNYTLNLVNGAYLLNVTANDTAGNLNSSQVSFTVAVDMTPPAVQMQSPTNTTYQSISIPLNFTASDASGISECRYELNGGANNTLAGCANTTIMASSGANTLRLWASDGVNWNSSAISFTVALQQRVSNTTITDSNGIGSASLNGIPPGAAHLSITAGSQAQAKAIHASQGVTGIRIAARVTVKGEAAQGKMLMFEVY